MVPTLKHLILMALILVSFVAANEGSGDEAPDNGSLAVCQSGLLAVVMVLIAQFM